MKRGQAGIEYIMMVGLLLIFLVPTVSYSVSQANTSIRVNQLENAVGRIARAANTVYGLGPGSMQVVAITVPTGVLSSLVSGKIIMYKVSMYGSVSDVLFTASVFVDGTLPTSPGTYTILIRTLDTGLVDIRQKT